MSRLGGESRRTEMAGSSHEICDKNHRDKKVRSVSGIRGRVLWIANVGVEGSSDR